MQTHSPDIYGAVSLAGSAGVAGQRLTSAGPGAQAVWTTEPVNPGVFKFTSASALSHVITHNLNNKYPTVTIYNTADDNLIIPATVVGTDVNTLTITFFAARAIAGTIVG